MPRARLAIQVGIAVIVLSVSLLAPDAMAGGAPFGYGVVLSNETTTYDFVGFPPVAAIAPLDVELLAGAFIGGDYSTLYAIDANGNLDIVDTATGVATLVGSLGVEPAPRASLGADPRSGGLFAILGDNNCDTTNLYSVDATTGATTLIAPVPECVASVAIDPAGLLYLLDTNAQALNVIDILGNETTLGPLGIALNPSARIAIDPVSGGLFLIEFDLGSFTNVIFSIDTTTGAATLVGPLGGENPISAPVLAPAPVGPPDTIFADGFDPPARVH